MSSKTKINVILFSKKLKRANPYPAIEHDKSVSIVETEDKNSVNNIELP